MLCVVVIVVVPGLGLRVEKALVEEAGGRGENKIGGGVVVVRVVVVVLSKIRSKIREVTWEMRGMRRIRVEERIKARMTTKKDIESSSLLVMWIWLWI